MVLTISKSSSLKFMILCWLPSEIEQLQSNEINLEDHFCNKLYIRFGQSNIAAFLLKNGLQCTPLFLYSSLLMHT